MHQPLSVYIRYVTWCQMPPDPLPPEGPLADNREAYTKCSKFIIKSVQFKTADISVRFLRLVYSMVEGIEEGRAAGKSPH